MNAEPGELQEAKADARQECHTPGPMEQSARSAEGTSPVIWLWNAVVWCGVFWLLLALALRAMLL